MEVIKEVITQEVDTEEVITTTTKVTPLDVVVNTRAVDDK